MRTSLKNNKGFSLVELMVVVSIIGILAAIAIPNFQRFTSRAKQAEAKANLSALYTAMRAYHAEFSLYRANFSRNGYAPTGNVRYNHGFSAENGTAPQPGEPNAGAVYFNSTAYCAVLANGCTTLQIPAPPGAVAGTPTNTTFIAQATAFLRQGAVADTWTIDQTKTFNNTSNGIN